MTSERRLQDSEAGEADAAEVHPMSFLRRLHAGWMVLAGRFGAVQTLVLLGFFYATLIGPAWLGTAVARRDLLDKGHLGEGDSAWRDADSSPPDLERAKLTS